LAILPVRLVQQALVCFASNPYLNPPVALFEARIINDESSIVNHAVYMVNNLIYTIYVIYGTYFVDL